MLVWKTHTHTQDVSSILIMERKKFIEKTKI